MREILFRGKRESDGKWLYGLYSDERVYGTDFPVIMPLETEDNDHNWAVIPETVGQYTGFLDVKKVRIFEGDIVKDVESGYHYIVKWFDEYGCYGLANKAGHMEIDVSELEIYIDYLVVVGNVHDSTEIRGLDDICKNSDEPSKTEFTLPEFNYEMVKKYSADNIGTAKFFADTVKGYICYATDLKRFYFYDGTRWERDCQEALHTWGVLMEFVKAVQAVIPEKPKGKPKEWSDKEAEEESINASYRKQYRRLCNVNGRKALLGDIKLYLQIGTGEQLKAR